jgi:tetratricopeptide (TPR) repeat protein
MERLVRRFRWGAPAVLVAAVALAGSISGVRNGFTYDDVQMIAENVRVHSLAHPWRHFAETYWPPEKFGGGATLYRPLPVLGFAIQWALGGGSPFPFHLISILLYVVVCLAFFGMALELLTPPGALLAGALFAAHPVHVEAVANVVGQSELLVNLFALLAVVVFLRGRSEAGLPLGQRLTIYACYALASLSKDNGLILPGLLLAAEFTVVRDPRPILTRLVALRTFWSLLLTIGLFLLVVRITVTGTLAGDFPHILILNASYGQRLMTMLRVSLDWFRLLLWPAHLQSDYAPRDFELARSFGLAQAAGLAMLLAAAWLTVAAWRKRPVVSFGVLWAAVAILPVSNLVFRAGILLAERTLFLASAGVMLVVGVVAAALYDRGTSGRRLMAGLGALLVMLGVVRSALRQPVWKDNATFFAQEVRDAPDNYHSHWSYGLHLYGQGLRESAYVEMATAIALYPADPNLYSDAGNLYRTDGHCDRAIEMYRLALKILPDLKYTRSHLASCLMRLGRIAEARGELRRLVADGHREFVVLMPAVDSAAAASGTFQ